MVVLAVHVLCRGEASTTGKCIAFLLTEAERSAHAFRFARVMLRAGANGTPLTTDGVSLLLLLRRLCICYRGLL